MIEGSATSKNHPKDILCDKNHLYKILLVHLTLNAVFKTKEKIFRWLDIQFKNNVKT